MQSKTKLLFYILLTLPILAWFVIDLVFYDSWTDADNQLIISVIPKDNSSGDKLWSAMTALFVWGETILIALSVLLPENKIPGMKLVSHFFILTYFSDTLKIIYARTRPALHSTEIFPLDCP